MEKMLFRVNPVDYIAGEIQVNGSKNMMLQVIWLPLLTQDEVIISNVPDISDTFICLNILRRLGVRCDSIGIDKYSFQMLSPNPNFLDTQEFQDLASRIRGTIVMMGACLACFGKFNLFTPGGDKIGLRPIEAHLEGVKDLGAVVSRDKDNVLIAIDKPKGKKIFQVYPSVTGTASTLLLSVFSEGKTEIINAACEPYIKSLCDILNQMGAQIQGHGSNRIHIKGVKSLMGVNCSILPDMIEVASFLSMSHLVGDSGLLIKNAYRDCIVEELGLLLPTFKKMGLIYEVVNNNIYVPKQHNLVIGDKTLNITDGPWPLFCPDWMSTMITFSNQCEGNTLWHQHMFEDRLFFTDGLRRMGCDIYIMNRHEVLVTGNPYKRLSGTIIPSPDIRAGLALLIASLSAGSETIIFGVDQIDRGYSKIEERLNNIGCNIKREVLS